MESDKPIKPNNLIFSKLPFDQKWHLGVDLSFVKGVSGWLEVFNDLVILLVWFSLVKMLHINLLLRIINFNLLLAIIYIKHSWISITGLLLVRRLIHALLHKLFGVQLFCHFHT